MKRRIAMIAALWPAAALAGPPYVTDDPQPTDLHRFEIYGFISAVRATGATAGASGIDFNYGGAKDLQLTAVVPLAFETGSDGAAGIGPIEIAAKYRFLHQREGSAMPDVSVFPRLFLPSGGARSGRSRTALLLPLFAERDWGRWSLFGGGGYEFDPGGRDFFQAGVALSRSIAERWTVGVEAYHRGPDARDGRSFTGAQLGATYRLSEHWSVIAAAGPGLQNAGSEGRLAAYAALKADF